MTNFFTYVGAILGGAIIIFIIMLAVTYPTMLLWNWLMPDIFGLKELEFWQTFGLIVLANVFFKSSNINSKK